MTQLLAAVLARPSFIETDPWIRVKVEVALLEPARTLVTVRQKTDPPAGQVQRAAVASGGRRDIDRSIVQVPAGRQRCRVRHLRPSDMRSLLRFTVPAVSGPRNARGR